MGTSYEENTSEKYLSIKNGFDWFGSDSGY